MGIPPAFSEGACTPRPNSFIPEPTRAILKNSYFCGSFFSRLRSVDSTFLIKSRSTNFKTMQVTAILRRCKSGGGRLPSLWELFLVISHGRCGLAIIFRSHQHLLLLFICESGKSLRVLLSYRVIG